MEDVDRLQDDWKVGVESFQKSEKVLSLITNLYRSYGLDVNGTKTAIDRIVAEPQASWISEIRAFLSAQAWGLAGRPLEQVY